MGKPTRFDFGSPSDGIDTTIRPSDYRARLDKATRLKVCCGDPQKRCRGQLGYVHEIRHVGGKWVTRELVMPPGWTRDERGVWRLIKWAQKREDFDRHVEPQTRGYRIREPQFRRGYVRNAILRTHRSLGEPVDTEPRQFGAYVTAFPAVAVCPVCHHKNVLDASQLDVWTEEDRARALEEHARRQLADPDADTRGRAAALLAVLEARRSRQPPSESPYIKWVPAVPNQPMLIRNGEIVTVNRSDDEPDDQSSEPRR